MISSGLGRAYGLRLLLPFVLAAALTFSALGAVAPARAAGAHHLTAWTFEVEVIEEWSANGYDEKFTASYAAASLESYDMTWTGSRNGSARFPCPGGGVNGYDIEGEGSGAGEFRPGVAYAEEWDVDPEQDWVSFVSFPEGGYTTAGTSLNCDGTASGATFGTEGPVAAVVFLPGTEEELRSLPVGTERTGTHTRTSTDAEGRVAGTTTVQFTARKGRATDSSRCNDPGAVRRYTAVDATGRLAVTALPDPTLGELTLGVGWCLTDAGARIADQPKPNAWASTTANWGFLGALEHTGIRLRHTEPKLTIGQRYVNAHSRFSFELSPALMLVNFAPTGKLVTKLGKTLKKGSKQLKKLDKRLTRAKTKVDKKHAKLLLTRYKRNFAREFNREARIAILWHAERLREKVHKVIRRIPVARKPLRKAFDKALDKSADQLSRSVTRATRPYRLAGHYGPRIIRDAVLRLATVSVPVWDARVALSVSDDGTAYVDDRSTSHKPFTVKTKLTRR